MGTNHLEDNDKNVEKDIVSSRSQVDFKLCKIEGKYRNEKETKEKALGDIAI